MIVGLCCNLNTATSAGEMDIALPYPHIIKLTFKNVQSWTNDNTTISQRGIFNILRLNITLIRRQYCAIVLFENNIP